VASPAAAQAPSAELEALHLPDAWATSTGEGVEVVVVHGPDDAAAVDRVVEAAPDAQVTGLPADTPADVAVALDDAASEGASVIAVTDGASLADETVQRSIGAVTDTGVVVVAPDPGEDVDLDDLPVVLVGDRGVTAGEVDEPTGTAYVAGAVALVAGQVTPAEAGELLRNTAAGDERTLDAEAAVDIAANLAAGGASLPPPEDRTGGLPPWLVGALAFGVAGLTVGGTIWLAGRRPRSSPGGH
jgi:hypothetical protein